MHNPKFRCFDCEKVFEKPAEKPGYPTQHSNTFHWVDKVCPNCQSEDFQDLEKLREEAERERHAEISSGGQI